MFHQLLTLTLDGIRASDYLTWVSDPEPPALGSSLLSIRTDADPLGTTVHLTLTWNVSPPSVDRAAALAGFPLTPEVAAVEPTRADPQKRHRPRYVTPPHRPATSLLPASG